MFRIASWYATAAYVLILVANAVFPDIGLTREGVRYVIAALALGFPVVLTLSWMFVPPSREDPQTFSRWKRMRWRMGSVVAVAVIAFVTLSGAYLWRLNARHTVENAGLGGPSGYVVVALPFTKIGQVDDALIAAIQGAQEVALSGLGSAQLVSNSALPMLTGPDRLGILARSVGATFVVQGSVEHSDAQANYIVHVEVVSVNGGQSLYSDSEEFGPHAALKDIARQIASMTDGPVRFLSGSDAWIAEGFPTTHDPRALQLLQMAMASFYYGSPGYMDLLHEVVDLDPHFAQAYAYLGLFTLDQANTGADQAGAQEIGQAEALVPGLPEAGLARAEQKLDADDAAGALVELEATEQPLRENLLQLWLHGYVLYQLGRWDEAVAEFRKAEAFDPLNFRPRLRLAEIAYAERDYEEANGEFSDYFARWPLYGNVLIWKAQVEFARAGDVDKLAHVIDSDWSAYSNPTPDILLIRRIELAHLQGRHAEVIQLIKNWPHARIWGTPLGTITHRVLWGDAMAAESLRLFGRAKNAREEAILGLAKVDDPADTSDAQAVHRALLEAFAGDDASARKSIAPLLARLSRPSSSWTRDDAGFSDDVAVVLAWCGDKAAAVKLLSDSLTAVYGAHAAILAHDPVWRPLYSEPAFAALLAAHGQKLAYAK